VSASGRTLFGAAFALAAAAAIAGGLVLVGSPSEARLRRLDDERVADLRRVSSVVGMFHARTGSLPVSLDEVKRQGAWPAPPVDPETGAAYEYRALEARRYELCATFSRASEEQPRGNTDVFWVHTEGRQCFPLDIKAVK
jgi:hypothetical protein